MDIVPRSKFGFKILFYIGAVWTAIVALSRLCFGESRQFIEKRKHEKENNIKVNGKVKVQSFIKEGKQVLREYWKRCIYAVILMALFNYCSHTSYASQTSHQFPTSRY